jgi:hypothetical protein
MNINMKLSFAIWKKGDVLLNQPKVKMALGKIIIKGCCGISSY